MAFTALAVFCVCNCAARPEQRTVPPVFVTNYAGFQLLPPSQCGAPLDMAQRISGKYGENEYAFTVWTLSDTTVLSMTLMNDMGGGIGELTYTGDAIKYTSNFTALPARPEYIAADFQFCFYDANALFAALEKCGLIFELNQEEQTEIRRISDNENSIIIEIKKTNNVIYFTNFLRSYSYQITGDFNASR
jgi:hypothetical protein